LISKQSQSGTEKRLGYANDVRPHRNFSEHRVSLIDIDQLENLLHWRTFQRRRQIQHAAALLAACDIHDSVQPLR